MFYVFYVFNVLCVYFTLYIFQLIGNVQDRMQILDKTRRVHYCRIKWCVFTTAECDYNEYDKKP